MIETFVDHDGEPDIKPATELKTYDGKRRRSTTHEGEGRDVKPFIPGSKDMPIDIDGFEEVDEEQEGRMVQMSQHQDIDPGQRPIIIRNVVYNITYNVINQVVQREEPPPYAPLPGLQPQAQPLPEARIEEVDPDFIPRRGLPAQAPPIPVVDPEPEIPTLSKSQQKILDTVLAGKSVLIHGSAGTGKSVLIRAIKKAFEARYEADHPSEPRPGPDFTRMNMTAKGRVASPLPEKRWKLRVTASTGLAAV